MEREAAPQTNPVSVHDTPHGEAQGGQPIHLSTPVVTVAAIVAASVVFLGLAQLGPEHTIAEMKRWGYVPSADLWRGQWWGLVTSAFVHLELWHVFFNLYWVWLLGAPLERAVGRLPMLGLIVGGAAVSSSVQVAFAGSTGIGLSGVVYALFGFIWWVRRKHGHFIQVIDDRTIKYFFIWLLVCVVITELGMMNIGNAAHASGLLFGLAAAECFVVRKRSWPALGAFSLFFLICLVPMVWSPWLIQWQVTKAIDAIEAVSRSVAGFRL